MWFHQYTYYSTYSLSFLDTPASPSWTLQVSHSWTLCCLEETLLRNFLGASDFKRTVVVLFSGRKGDDLESHSHLCHGRKGCLQKKDFEHWVEDTFCKHFTASNLSLTFVSKSGPNRYGAACKHLLPPLATFKSRFSRLRAFDLRSWLKLADVFPMNIKACCIANSNLSGSGSLAPSALPSLSRGASQLLTRNFGAETISCLILPHP